MFVVSHEAQRSGVETALHSVSCLTTSLIYLVIEIVFISCSVPNKSESGKAYRRGRTRGLPITFKIGARTLSNIGKSGSQRALRRHRAPGEGYKRQFAGAGGAFPLHKEPTVACDLTQSLCISVKILCVALSP